MPVNVDSENEKYAKSDYLKSDRGKKDRARPCDCHQ